MYHPSPHRSLAAAPEDSRSRAVEESRNMDELVP